MPVPPAQDQWKHKHSLLIYTAVTYLIGLVSSEPVSGVLPSYQVMITLRLRLQTPDGPHCIQSGFLTRQPSRRSHFNTLKLCNRKLFSIFGLVLIGGKYFLLAIEFGLVLIGGKYFLLAIELSYIIA